MTDTVDLNAHRERIESCLDDMIALGERAHLLRTQLTGERNRRVRLVEVDGLIGGVPSNGYDLEDHVIEPGVIHYGTDML